MAESVRELRQAVWEFVTITQEDIMKDLKVEKPDADYQPSLMTIFSWVLDSPADKQVAVKTSPHSEGGAGCCAPPSPEGEWKDSYMLVIISSVSQLTLGPGGNNLGRGRNVFGNPQMVAVFPTPHQAICHRGTTITELNE